MCYLSSEVCDDGIYYMKYLKPPKQFKYDGLIWHHLLDYVEQMDILDESGTWVKTDMKTFEQAFNKSENNDRFNSSLKSDEFKGIPSRHKNCYSKDSYEVFIEKKKLNN